MNSQTGMEQLEKSFDAARMAVEKACDSEDAWSHLEAFCDTSGFEEKVANVYRQVLDANLDKSAFELVARRAVAFYNEWFGDTPRELQALLCRIIEIDDESRWAFDRLTEMLSAAGDWETLFSMYDNALAKCRTDQRRKDLLDEAASIARDMADQPDLALKYLLSLQSMDRRNRTRLNSIERMLEKRERWKDLITLWREHLAILSPEEALETRMGIAECHVSKTGDFAAALQVINEILMEHPGLDRGCSLSLAILTASEASVPLRLQALDLLLVNYQAVNRSEDMVSALEIAIAFSEDTEKSTLLRKAGNALAILGRDVDAMGHYADLLALIPSDADAQKQLRILAIRSKRYDLRADALLGAANVEADDSIRVGLLCDAAELYVDHLDNAAKAVEIYSQLLQLPDLEHAMALRIAYRLNHLLSDQEQDSARLAVLEKIASLEPTTVVRRTVLQEAAKLAAQLDNPEQALEFWNALLAQNENDVEALTAVIHLEQQQEHWDRVATALQRRAGSSVLREQRRSDLVQVAAIQLNYLADEEAAAETWKTVYREYGPRKDVVEQLDELLSRSGQYGELAEMLKTVVEGEHQWMQQLLLRLGDLYRNHLENPEAAVLQYGRALSLSPDNVDAREALTELLEVESAASTAVHLLLEAMRRTDDITGILSLTEHRLRVETDAQCHVQILKEAARLFRNGCNDSQAALELLCRAFPMAPADVDIEADIRALAADLDRYDVAVDALERAAEASADGSVRQLELLEQTAQIREAFLNDAESGLRIYSDMLQRSASGRRVFDTVLRLSARTGNWVRGSHALLVWMDHTGTLDTDGLTLMASAAAARDEWPALAKAMETAVSGYTDLRSDLLRDIELILSRWFMEHCADRESAAVAAGRAVHADGSHLEARLRWREFQEQKPTRDYLENLRAIFHLQPNSLEPLRAGAKAAAEILTEYDDIREQLVFLFEEACRFWRLSVVSSDGILPSECVLFAATEVARLDLENQRPESAARFLQEASVMPFDDPRYRFLLLQAANLYQDSGNIAAATEVFQQILKRIPDDMEVMGKLDALLENSGQILEILSLRSRMLHLTDSVERKMKLRLDLVRMGGMMEGSDARAEMLRENLSTTPGHPESLAAIQALYENRGAYEELVRLLIEQGDRLLKTGESERAADLLEKAAVAAETRIPDRDRAVDLYTRVCAIRKTPGTLDALARLHAKRGDLVQSAQWLQARLEIAEPEERVSILIRLARTLLQIGKGEDAVRHLEMAFEQAPQNAEVRKLLLERYRETGARERLASSLERSAHFVKDRKTKLGYAREAAIVFVQQLDTPSRAVSVLQLVVSLDPEDADAKSMLADSLLEAEQYDEAQGLLEEILDGFGRRRSPARAAVHAKLASVIHAQGDVEAALNHLEQAAGMEPHNIRISKRLAELAAEKGDLDLAERTWRSLLMTVRRDLTDAGAAGFGPALILLELSLIADQRGQNDKTIELKESAFEALSADDSQAEMLENRIQTIGDLALLEKLYLTRLGYLTRNVLRGRVSANLATLYEGPMDRPQEAFSMWLQAISENPGTPSHHDGAIAIAEKLKCFDAYVARIEELLSRTSRTVDTIVRCELLLRLVEIRIVRNEHLDEAAALFSQAEALEVREVDVLRMGSRLAGARGDTEEQIRLLKKLSAMGENTEEPDTQVDALYRLAEIHLANEDTFAEGVEELSKAFDGSGKADRAARILRRTAGKGRVNEPFVTVFEKVARQSGDRDLLLGYFDLLSRSQDTPPSALQEGALLALDSDQADLAEQLLARMVEGAELHPECTEAVAWAMLGLGRRRQEAGDPAGALKYLMDAADISDDEEVFRFGVELGDAIRHDGGDLVLASRVYERLLSMRPGCRGAWQPLADIYCALADIDGFECLVEETLFTIEDTSERNGLRLKWAAFLLDQEGRESDAVDTMKNVLLDDPGNAEALSMLSQHYLRSGELDDLLQLLLDRFHSAVERRSGVEVRGLAIELGRHTDRETARDIYREALTIAGEDRDLLLALIDTLDSEEDGRERVTLLERTLATEDGEKAVELTLKVAAAYADMNDPEGATRTLKNGFQNNPADDRLKTALESDYRRREDYAGLIAFLKQVVVTQDDPQQRVLCLGEIADICRDTLQDVNTEMWALTQMEADVGHSPGFGIRWIEAANRAGQVDAAMNKADVMLTEITNPEHRFELLPLRAAMRQQKNDPEGAMADLEEAFQLQPESIATELEAIYEKIREIRRGAGDLSAERVVVYKLAALYDTVKRNENLRTLLLHWLAQVDEDIYGWQALLKLEIALENWEGVIEACKKLTVLTEGEAQIEVGRTLTAACRKLGQMEIARRGLEYIFRENIDGTALRDDLKQIYEEIGAWSELAAFHAHDAQISTDPAQRAHLFRRAGDAYLKSGDTDTALLALNEALSIEPDNLEAVILAIDIEIEKGDLDAAEGHATDAIEACTRKRSPEMAELQLRMATIADRNGDRVEQLNWLDQASASDRTDGTLLSRVADLAEEIQEWEIALKALKNISLFKGECPVSKAESFFRQGRIAYHQGDEKRAQLFVKKAIQEDRSYQEAIDFLERLS